MSAKGFLDWMPVAASSWASSIDKLNNFITYTAAFCTVAITGAMLYFAFKYRRRGDNDQTAYITHNSALETVWTVIPTIVCIVVGWVGFDIYRDMRTPPANAVEINVSGRKWAWSYTYPNGKTGDKDLYVPVNTPVKLILKSQDVNHSFFLPAMRVKEDVIASEYHYLWFTANQTGTFPIFCAEYCGTEHSGMMGTLHVVSAPEYSDYISDRKAETLSPEELGRKLYSVKGCQSCHSLDGSAALAPSFKNLFGRTEHYVEAGVEGELVVDENYLSESILHPQKKIVKGYGPIMPAFEGQLKDEEINGLIAFIKTVK